MIRLLTPNKVTLARMILGCAAVALYAADARDNALPVGIAALALTIGVIALDGVDGYLARRFNLATPLGAQLDILGDRVIENIFFIYFAVCGEISLWVPVIIFVRGTLADFQRGIAVTREAGSGENAEEFRRNWMLRSRWGQMLVASRFSRGAYAAMKCICFVALGLEWTLLHSHARDIFISEERIGARVNVFVAATVVFCLVRALPVFWEGCQDVLVMARPVGNLKKKAKPLAPGTRAVAATR
ncbi:MAG TPA: CDP-alcohol phosphatidyltransferase family protein [Candidatus Acidoferrum sp.]|nr:CDP-alcohol phosphatidyltransferase family protein [Candidatus Acidoferrum sp.]